MTEPAEPAEPTEPGQEGTVKNLAVVISGNDVVAGSSVTSGFIYLDANPYYGVSASQLTALVSQPNSVTSSVTGLSAGLVTTGSVISFVTSENDVITYTIIIIGDTNCDGVISSGDSTLMYRYATLQGTLSDVALLAADANWNGRSCDSGDATKVQNKYLQWEIGAYHTAMI